MEPDSTDLPLNESTPLITREDSSEINLDINRAIAASPSWLLYLARDIPISIICLGCFSYHALLGICYRWQHLNHKNNPALENAIKHFDKALAFASPGRKYRGSALNFAGHVYYLRYLLLKDDEDLRRAYNLYYEAARQPLTRQIAQQVFPCLGKVSQTIYEVSGQVEYLDFTIFCHGQFLEICPEGENYRAFAMWSLAHAHTMRYSRFYNSVDFEKTIEYANQAVQLLPSAHRRVQEDSGIFQSVVSIIYATRFERFGDIADLNAAIDGQNQTISELGPKHPSRHFALNTLGSLYSALYDNTSEMFALDKSIACHIESISLLPKGDIKMPGYLSSTSHSYIRRFMRLGDLSDIDQAITYLYEGIASCAASNPNKVHLVDGLGYALMVRFDRLKDLADLDRGIDYLKNLNSLLYAEHTLKIACLDHLGSAYRCLYRHLHNISDIQEAISCHREALSYTPEDHEKRPIFLSNLGDAYLLKFLALQDIADIETAIEYQAQAILVTKSSSIFKIIYLDLLGMMYAKKFTYSRQLLDIEHSITHLQEALKISEHDNPLRPLLLQHLGTSYHTKLLDLIAHDISDSDAFPPASTTQFSEEFVLDFNYALPRLSTNRHRELNKQESELVLKSIECFQSASLSNCGAPSELFTAARCWAVIASYHKLGSPLAAYRRVLELLPQVIWFGSTVYRRHEDISQIGDVVLEATALAIEHQEYRLAFEWLEEGRSIVWKQMLQLRTPVDELSLVDKELATKLQQVARSLEAASQRDQIYGLHSSSMPPQEGQAQNHRRLAAQWDQLVAQARAYPGFEDFLKPKKFSDLLQAACSHTVVAINIHSRHCDALVIRPGFDQVVHVPLPGFSALKAREVWSQMLSDLGLQNVRTSQERRPVFLKQENTNNFSSILRVLWDGIVKPVLDSCGFTMLSAKYVQPTLREVDKLPRVIWCTTGLLSFLPLHAAGNYDSPHERIFNYVVSSYTPTVSALLTYPPAFNQPCRILAISQAQTTGCEALPGTVRELDEIQHQASRVPMTRLEGDRATIQNALEEMKHHNWVHFACHASQSNIAASLSAFHLHDGNLDLATIMKQSYTNRGFAFLSGCQTARGDEKMAEEAVHLAAAMIMLGYPTVIATMWSIKDSDAPYVAEKVYSHLLKDQRPDCQKAAAALHNAVKHLRETLGEDKFVRWIPFIHIGL